jgi:hypothetical protein
MLFNRVNGKCQIRQYSQNTREQLQKWRRNYETENVKNKCIGGVEYNDGIHRYY